MKEQGNLWENILDFVVKHYKEDTFDTQKAFKKFQQLSDYGNYARQRTLRLYKAVGIAASILVKTEDIHPPKTGISVHFCVLSLMAMQK